MAQREAARRFDPDAARLALLRRFGRGAVGFQRRASTASSSVRGVRGEVGIVLVYEIQ